MPEIPTAPNVKDNSGGGGKRYNHHTINADIKVWPSIKSKMIEYFSVFRKSWLLKKSQRLKDWCQEYLRLTIIIGINKYWLGVESMLAQWWDRETRWMNANNQGIGDKLTLIYKNEATGQQENRIFSSTDTDAWSKGKNSCYILDILLYLNLFCFVPTNSKKPVLPSQSLHKGAGGLGGYMNESKVIPSSEQTSGTRAQPLVSTIPCLWKNEANPRNIKPHDKLRTK